MCNCINYLLNYIWIIIIFIFLFKLDWIKCISLII